MGQLKSIEILKIASRGSELALLQAATVAARLRGALDALGCGRPDLQMRTVRTIGDQHRDGWARKSRELDVDSRSRKWTLEVEQSVESGAFDLAVHSGKDLPYRVFDGTRYLPIFEREDPRDVFIPRDRASTVEELRDGGVIGVNSNRRRANLQALRPDLRFAEYSGNVPTRLSQAQMAKKGVDGAVLAAAGLQRLRLFDPASMRPLSIEHSLPAATQGIIAVQVHEEAAPELLAAIQSLQHAPTAFAWDAERAFLSAFDTGCETPISVYADVRSDSEGGLASATLSAIAPQSGGQSMRFEASADLDGLAQEDALARAQKLGDDLAQSAIAAGARKKLATSEDFPSVSA
ncbi:MAG: hydroxymethylbilane synthase [Neomegalonema sp.]|nr:hydroxymethylbilane synthase [Neomegalonema sp.]